jgi:acyl-CoA thioester hydrolase
MARPTPHRRAEYTHLRTIPTRWMDNDVYGHLNNIVYYAFFDTVVNTWLIERGALDIAEGPVVGYVVETGCHYFSQLAYPQTVIGGLRVAHVGRSSVRYEIALFAEDSEVAAAQGHFIHVYVDRATSRPVSLPPVLRAAVEKLTPGTDT